MRMHAVVLIHAVDPADLQHQRRLVPAPPTAGATSCSARRSLHVAAQGRPRHNMPGCQKAAVSTTLPGTSHAVVLPGAAAWGRSLGTQRILLGRKTASGTLHALLGARHHWHHGRKHLADATTAMPARRRRSATPTLRAALDWPKGETRGRCHRFRAEPRVPFPAGTACHVAC